MCKKLSFLIITALLSSAAMYAMESSTIPAATQAPVAEVTPATCTTYSCKVKQACGAWLEKAKTAACTAKEKVGTLASTAKGKTEAFANNAKTKIGQYSHDVIQAAKNTTPKQRLVIGAAVVGTVVVAYCIYKYFKKPAKKESKE